MVLDIILPVLAQIITDPITNYIVAPIKRHICYAFTCDSNLERLEHEAQQLKNRKDRLQDNVDRAARNGELIYDNVTQWLTRADDAIGEADQIVHLKEQAKAKCFIGLCPNLKRRYQLSKRADKKASAVDKVGKEEGLDSISYLPPPKQKVAPSVYAGEALDSRVSILNEIMGALKDPSLNMIGVYGMGGVGKTTLAKEVHRQAQEDKLFEVVVLVAVSQTPDHRRIQKQIAEALGLDLVEEDMLIRANRLTERLKKGKILIILDDIWRQLQLEELGILSGDDCKGCKLLLTSRSHDVLSRQMRTQKDFKLEVLPEEEARSLFQKNVGDAQNPIAAAIAQKCAGLPLLILTVAMDLRNKDSYAWNDKLKQLSVFGDQEIQAKVHSVLESSYNSLHSDELKSLFLLCGLFGQSNIRIQHLLMYGMGLGLFKHRAAVEDARNRLFTLIDDLKAASLLLDGDMDGFVKMHDVVRDTAMSIASRVQHAFIGSSELKEWPKKDCTRISLPYNDVGELTARWKCPVAELLFVFTEDFSFKISDLFFEGIRELKVLDFTGIHFESLPSSLSHLTNLHALCLHRGQLDNLDIIGGLKQLEVLSFAESHIVELPREIEQLTQLKLLDLSNCSKLKVIPANVLSKLSLLEALYMENSFVEWEADEINSRGNASLVELQYLSRLTTLEMQVLDARIMPKSLFLNLTGLKNYRIVIGAAWDWSVNNESSTTLKLSLNTSIQREHGIKKLLKETEELYLDEVRGIENVLYDLDGDGFPRLKHLHVQNDSLIQHIINSTKRSLCPPAFPILHSLFLDNVSNLEDICHGQLATDSFSKLKVLEVGDCKRLISLFSICRSREENDVNVGDGNNNQIVELTQLCSLKLNNLPQLRSFCKEKDEVGASLSVFNRLVSLPSLEDLEIDSIRCEKIWQDHLSATSSNLTSFIVWNCDNLKHLFTTSIVKSLLHLKKLDIYDCSSMEEIMLTEESPEEEEEEEAGRMNKIQLFPKLNTFELHSLPKLIRFCTASRPIEFQSLRELNIYSCPAMMTFVHCLTKCTDDNKMDSAEAEQVNPNFEIQSLFDGMVQFSSLEEMNLGSMDNLKSIWHSQLATHSFCKLKSLTIKYCPKLLTVFPIKLLPRFHTLEKLDLYHCHSLQEIFQFPESEVNDVVAFKLRELTIYHLDKLKLIWSKDPQTAITFQELKSIHVEDCEFLKNICPVSIARGLLQIQQLEIRKCGKVEEIVARAEEGAESEQPYFKFPELTSLTICELPKMKSLYGGRYRAEWPKLKCLDVRGCNKAMKYGFGSDHEITNPFLFMLEKDNHNLEELTLEHKDLLRLQRAQFRTEYYFSKLKVLKLLDLRDSKLLFDFLKTLYNLKKLIVYGSLSEEEIFSEETFEILVQLKYLEISCCYDLKHIWKQNAELKPLIQTSSSLFQNLATLKVSSCSKLKSLMTVSIAKALVQLKKMSLFSCDMMTQVVENDGDDSEDEIITFSKLKILKLEHLNHLTSFCSGNHNFGLPVLEEVIIDNCPRMKIFSYGVSITPKLRSIKESQFSSKQFWKGNLNATITSFLTDKIDKYLQLSAHPELINIWHDQHLGRRFHNVEEVIVDKCEIFTKAISSNLLQYLDRLTEMEVKGCASVVEVFDLEGLSIDKRHVGLLPRLNELRLIDLPMLRHLWNKDPKEILELKNLRSVKVQNCSSLKYVFSQTEATCLVQLQEIKLQNCYMMEGIIKKDETEASHTILPSLESLVLECLPNFTSLCSGIGNLECPALKKITIYNCPNVRAFSSTLTTMEQRPKRNDGWGQKTSLFSHKVISNLEKLSLDSKSIGMIRYCEWLPEHFSNVKVVKLCFFTPKSCSSLFDFFQRLPNLENLVVESCALKELFLLEDAMILPLPQIRVLKLDGVDDLKNIWKTSALLQSPLFEHLEALEVRSCENLIDLGPSSASFQNLTTVKIYICNGLKNMFTPSVAKSLVQLETLSVESCVSLTEIVTGQQGGIMDEIVFNKLRKLELQYLQSLTSFCSGCYTFHFPSLKEVEVFGCPNLRIFCPGDLKTPKLDNLKFDYRYHWEGNLNATIQQLYINMVGLHEVGHLTLSKFPMLKENWHGQFPFNNLSVWTLVVDECASFSNAIPSNLLQYLKSLKVLFVEKCDSLVEVFDLKGLNADEAEDVLMRKLTELHLIDLPMLRHVWNKDPHGILRFKNLTLLKLQNCSQLTHIFTLSVALGLKNLEQIEIKGCSSVEQIIIVGDEEIALWEDHKIKTIFPSLESMCLECLPSLLSFYCANGVLECPSLKRIDFIDCPKMNLFPPAEQVDSIMIVEAKKETLCKDVLVSPFLGSKVAIPSLEELQVEWKAMKNISWHENFLCGLKELKLRCFPGEFSLFESDLLQKFPNMEIGVVASDSFFRGISEEDHATSLLPPLKVTVSSSVSSFRNLIALEVSNCHGLTNLMTASAATSLVQLKKMDVKDCELMQEIMSGTEGDDVVEDHEIGFGQLTFLGLENLPCLTSFCSANVAFNFPSLEEVIVRECPKMKTFAKQVFGGPKLWRVQTGKHEYEWEWEGSLNNTIEALYMEMSVEETS